MNIKSAQLRTLKSRLNLRHMHRSFSTMILFLYLGSTLAQITGPEDLGFKACHIADPDLGDINFYISGNGEKSNNPLLLYLDGSGSDPLFQKIPGGGIGSTVVIDFDGLSKDFQVILISKPGVPFLAEVKTEPSGRPYFPPPDSYVEQLSLDWRVRSADLIINQLMGESTNIKKEVVILGFSEGAQVGPFLANTNKDVSHLILFGGNGLNQFIDPIISARIDARLGRISENESQYIVDSLFKNYEGIYADPTNTEKNWWGHTYLRWASFTAEDPVRALSELDIPIYFANGSLDENSVLSADYIKLEFLRNRKKNLTYRTYPGMDHHFNLLTIENQEVVDATPKLEMVLDDAFKWLAQNR